MRASLLRLSAAFLALGLSTQLYAGSASAPLQVSVTVIARAILTVASQPSAITVTQADIARGYIDVATPIVLHVQTNSRAGYLLQADKESADLGSIELTFGDARMTISDTESWMSRPYVPGGETVAMNARVHLTAGTQPGSYPLPLAFSVRPL